MLHDATTVFLWDSPEFEFRHKSPDWYWTIGLIGLLLTLLAIFSMQDFFFAGFALLATILIIVLAKRRPSMMRVELSESGVRIADTSIPFQKIDAFWIDTEYGKERSDMRTPIIVIGVIAILIAIFVMKDYFFAGFFALSTILLIVGVLRRPTENIHPHLMLYSEQTTLPISSIHLPTNVNLVDLRDFLLDYLPELEMRESYIKQLSDVLRF